MRILRIIKAHEVQPGMVVADWYERQGKASRGRHEVLEVDRSKPYISYAWRDQTGFEGWAHTFGDVLLAVFKEAD